MKISIIIPVYNSGAYLRECLDSVTKQEMSDIEIIIVNDGSTDNSSEIIEEYKNRYQNIVLIHQKNCGQSAARNVALKAAKGEYIGFVDSDDIIETQMYPILYDTAITYGLDIVEAQYTLVKNMGKKQRREIPAIYSHEEALKRLFLARVGTIWSCLYKAELFQKLYFPNKQIGEDLYIKAALFQRADKIGVISNQLYFYRQRTGSVTHNGFDSRFFDIIDTNRAMTAYLKKNDTKKYECYRDNLQNMCIQDVYTIIERAVMCGYRMEEHIIENKSRCNYINRCLNLGMKKNRKQYFSKYIKLCSYMINCKYRITKNKKTKGDMPREKYSIYYSMALQWLFNKEKGKTIASYLKEKNYKRIAIYGAKDLGELTFQELKSNNIEVAFFIDRNASEQSLSEDGIRIIGLDALCEEQSVDAIIITPIFDYEKIHESILSRDKNAVVLSLEDIVYQL